MARVLFINGGSEGHVNPTIGVVQELISRGEEVVYFCIEAYRERMEKTGAAVRTFDDQKFIKAFISGGRNYMLERINGLLLTADIVIPSVLEQIEGERFDYIIHDSMFGCGRLLAQILKLPAISSCTSFAQTEESFDNMMEPFFAQVPAEIVEPINDRFQSLTAMVKDKYDVEIHSPYEVFCNPAPLTIVYTTREFQPYGETFDQTYKFVGPSIASRLTQEPFDMAAITEKKTIYISLGTVFNQAIDFYKLCLEAFGDTDHTVVMSVGNKTPLSDLGEIPANFIVKNYVPQTEVLQHAKLFITHGGMNSTHEGLYYGVPLIVIPQSADQPIIAGQVASLGAGVPLQMQSLTADRLREAAEHVLTHPSFTEAVAAIRESFRKSGGYQQAVDEIFGAEWRFSMELQQITQNLKETRDELLGILDGLSGDQLTKRKDAHSWNIGQICHHLIKTEELYILAIRRGLKSKEDSFIENKPLDFLLDRNNKIEAPEVAQPTNEILAHTEIIDKLKLSRDKLYEILNALEDPSVLGRRHFTHPVFKEMLLIEWIKSLYIHEQRHIQQINEIRDVC